MKVKFRLSLFSFDFHAGSITHTHTTVTTTTACMRKKILASHRKKIKTRFKSHLSKNKHATEEINYSCLCQAGRDGTMQRCRDKRKRDSAALKTRALNPRVRTDMLSSVSDKLSAALAPLKLISNKKLLTESP